MERERAPCNRARPAGLPSLARYRTHLEATADWIDRSIAHGLGGSCASYMPLRGWSKPYPETTGYLISTLLDLDAELPGRGYRATAAALGDWLLGIRNADGVWNGGLHPGKAPDRPSVFNTGQIVDGLVSLHRHTRDARWIDAASTAADWLAAGMGDDGLWRGMDYRAGATPSYYTHVAWPMLEVWSETRRDPVRAAAERFLRVVLTRIRGNGSIERWGFDDGDVAFTHTIAYALRGLLEAARLLDDWPTWARPVEGLLERIRRLAERSGGRLPGAFDSAWRPRMRGICLTGNSQLAICLLLWEARVHDLRIVNAAAKLVDAVCAHQRLARWPADLRGAVPGTAPVWGRYMRLRYPNWAAKYHCDALLRLSRRVAGELAVAR